MDKSTKTKFKTLEEQGGELDATTEYLTGRGESASDPGSPVSRPSKPGPRSLKTKSPLKEGSSLTVTGKSVKRKDVSPLLGAGKSLAPDKRRRRKTKFRLIDSDRESGSEAGSEIESDHFSEASSVDKSVARSQRASRRRAVVAAAEEKEQEKRVNRPKSPVLASLDLASLGELGRDWLTGIDEARLRSGNLKGDLSGQIKRLVDKSKELVSELVARLDDRGDATFLRGQITELTANLRALKCSEEARSRELDTLKREVDILRSRIQADRGDDKLGRNSSTVTQRVDFPALGGGSLAGTQVPVSAAPKVILDRLPSSSPLPQRSQRPGTSRDHSNGDTVKSQGGSTTTNKPPLDLVTLSEIDEASIDEIVFNLIELRNKRRPHLPPLSQPLRGNLTVIPPPDPSVPPKRGRGRPRIIRNEQVVPPLRIAAKSRVSSDAGTMSTPQPTVGADPGWIPVKRRRRRRTGASGTLPARVQPGPSTGTAPVSSGAPPSQTRRRPPRTAAVTITGSGEGFSYAATLKRARDNIPLSELGIERSRIRRTINGGRIIEIPGLDAAKKADELAEKLRGVLGPDVMISRPCIRGEIRIIGLDDTVSSEEVVTVVSDLGGCPTSDIKVGTIRPMANGLGAVWVQCPLAAANKVSAMKKIRIGWTTARVELLATRPIQCFKC